MSVYHIIVAKILTSPKLEKPFILFDLCCDDRKVPKNVEKDLKSEKIIKNDVKEFLADPDPDCFLQKEFISDQLLKTIFFKPDKTDLEIDQPSYVLYISCITDLAINERKVGSFLKELCRVIRDNHQAEIKDKNSKIDTVFANACWQTIDNFNLGPYDSATGEGGPVINFKNVRLGGEKIEKLKQSLLDSIIKMNDNREQVEKLNANAQNLRQEAYKFKKQAQEVEDEMKKRNRWCTKRFIFLYLIITILVLAAIIIVLILKL
ncbi:unnamed protein product [Moneuplotes crassus]|uniref:V-SNARE coiled-coil homology domain-containing protein n=1 Tax=Euplotes crassus TaxID=5936 RepID=A0AAD1XT63_EUPCR|nr:unnamed protein product [Moneuplotes crassus]